MHVCAHGDMLVYVHGHACVHQMYVYVYRDMSVFMETCVCAHGVVCVEPQPGVSRWDPQE